MQRSVSSKEGERLRPIQLILRETGRNDLLAQLVDQVMTDYGQHLRVVLPHSFSIEEGGETWIVDREGKYQKCEEKIRCLYSTKKEEREYDVRKHIAKVLNRWWWIPAAISLPHDWLSR